MVAIAGIAGGAVFVLKSRKSIEPANDLAAGITNTGDAGAVSSPLNADPTEDPESDSVLEACTCSCGTSLPAHVTFCNNCGAPRSEENESAAQTMAAAAQYTPPVLDDDMQGVLMALGLEKYFVALRDEVGCVFPTDLDELDREDLVSIAMSQEEIGRLLGRNNTVSPQTSTSTAEKRDLKTAPAAAVTSGVADTTLDSVLLGLGLEKYTAALRDLGCVDVRDLDELDKEDLVEVGMDETEIGRLQGDSL